MIDNQVVSKQRVSDHGEVYTNKREVNAMLDLVKQETERIDARFLEPACGTGNFLVEILTRKLRVVASTYAKSQLEYESNAVKAVSSIYGIDILEDNVIACRQRLFDIFDQSYRILFKHKVKPECLQVVKTILKHNIVWGNALTLKTVDDPPQPIVFAEWTFIDARRVKRRDFKFEELLPGGSNQRIDISDEGHVGFSSTCVKEYPPIHFLRIVDLEPITV